METSARIEVRLSNAFVAVLHPQSRVVAQSITQRRLAVACGVGRRRRTWRRRRGGRRRRAVRLRPRFRVFRSRHALPASLLPPPGDARPRGWCERVVAGRRARTSAPPAARPELLPRRAQRRPVLRLLGQRLVAAELGLFPGCSRRYHRVAVSVSPRLAREKTHHAARRATSSAATKPK